jgi:hypothetical protein
MVKPYEQIVCQLTADMAKVLNGLFILGQTACRFFERSFNLSFRADSTGMRFLDSSGTRSLKSGELQYGSCKLSLAG